MNSKTSKISDRHRLRFNLADKMDLRRGDKRVALSCIIRTQYLLQMEECKTINFKYQEQHGIKSLNFQMDLIPYQTFKTISYKSSGRMKNCQIGHQSKHMSYIWVFATSLIANTSTTQDFSLHLFQINHSTRY